MNMISRQMVVNRAGDVKSRRCTHRQLHKPARRAHDGHQGGNAMRHCLLAVGVAAAAMTVSLQAQTPASATPETLVADAKRAAGRDHAGTFLRICVAPDNLSGGAPRPAPGARTVPDRATWYAQPYKVFDDLYF